MYIFIKGLILLMQFLIIPYLIGTLIVTKSCSDSLKGLECIYVLGLLGSFSIFWVICTAMTFLKAYFSELVAIYSLVIYLTCGFAILKLYRQKNFKRGLSFIKFTKYEWVYLIVFLLLLCVQVYFALFYQVTYNSYDDYTYVTMSSDIINSDRLYMSNVMNGKLLQKLNYKRAMNSWNAYIAYMSEISGLSVATIAHTVIPVVFLLIAYIVFHFISVKLLDKREDRLILLCFISILFIFGLYSNYSLTFRLLVALWQGKAVLSVIIIPFLVVVLPEIYNSKINKGNLMVMLSVILSACSMTMMGAAMVLCILLLELLLQSISNLRLTGGVYTLAGCIVPMGQLIVYVCLR